MVFFIVFMLLNFNSAPIQMPRSVVIEINMEDLIKTLSKLIQTRNQSDSFIKIYRDVTGI